MAPLLRSSIVLRYLLLLGWLGLSSQGHTQHTSPPTPGLIPGIKDTLYTCPQSGLGISLGMGLPAQKVRWSPALGLSDQTAVAPQLDPALLSKGWQVYVRARANARSQIVRDSFWVYLADQYKLTLLGPQEACPGPDYFYQVANQATQKYQWQVQNGRAQILPDGRSIRVSWDPNATEGIITVRSPDACAQGHLKVAISSFSVEPLRFVSPNCHDTFDGSMTVQSTGGQAPYQYLWDSGEMGAEIGDLSVGAYTVVSEDAQGCQARATFVLAAAEPLQLKLLEKGDASCDQLNGFAVVQAQGGTGEYQLSWDHLPDFGGIGLDKLAPDDYVVRVQDGKGCQDTLAFRIDNTPPDFAQIGAEPSGQAPLCLEQAEVQFHNHSRNASRYYWDFGDGITSQDSAPTHRFTLAGEYQVVLTAYDPSESCPDTDTMTFVVQASGVVYVPDAFTPNGDGINDTFRLVGESVKEIELDIFNRKGQRLVTLRNLQQGWDGRGQNGKPLPPGIYSYVLNARLDECQFQQKAGTLNLLR